jgi:CRP-like cAMP-binding protein
MNARDRHAIGRQGVPPKGREKGRKYSDKTTARVAHQGGAVGETASVESRPLSLLDSLNSRELKLLLERCVERQVAAGTPLFEQTAPHTATFIVKHGLVRTYYASPSGKEVTVGFWSDGDMVGGPDFFDESMHVWSGEAVEDSLVWAIKGRDLRELSLKVPAIAECVIAALSFKLRWVSRLLQNMGTESVRHRLAHLLVSLSDMYGVKCEEGIRIRYPFTQEDLANMICATRQWVNMTFRRFQQEGIVRIVKRRLVILDMAGLHRMAKEPPEGDMKD